MLFREVVHKYRGYMREQERSPKTIQDYFNELTLLGNYLAERYNCPVYIADIGAEDIVNYLNHLRHKGRKPASRNKILYTLRSLFKYAVKYGIVEGNPALGIDPVKTPKKERTYLTVEEVSQLVRVIDHPIAKAAAQTMYYTGLRVSECFNLKLMDIDLENRVLQVVNGKGNKDRSIPINDRCHAVLVQYLEHTRPEVNTDWLFATENTGQFCSRYFNRLLSTALEKLDWKKKVTPHTLRHSFASRLVKEGVNLVHVQRLLGHSDPKTTAIYVHSNLDELADAVNRM